MANLTAIAALQKPPRFETAPIDSQSGAQTIRIDLVKAPWLTANGADLMAGVVAVIMIARLRKTAANGKCDANRRRCLDRKACFRGQFCLTAKLTAKPVEIRGFSWTDGPGKAADFEYKMACPGRSWTVDLSAVKPPRKLWGFDSLPAHHLRNRIRIHQIL